MHKPRDDQPNLSPRPARFLGGVAPASMGEIFETLAVGALVFLLAWASLTLTRMSGRIAAVWPVNAVVLINLLRADLRRWPSLLLAGFMGDACANVLAGDTPSIGFGLSACNGVEVLIVAGGLRRFVGRKIELSRCRDLMWFAGLAGVLAPLVAAVLASSLLHPALDKSFVHDLSIWVLADGLGLLIVVPPLLALTPEAIARLSANGRGPRNALLLTGASIALIALFGASRHPLPLLAWPPLLLLAFEMEAVGAAIGLLVTAIVSVGFALTGRGITPLWQMNLTENVLRLQLFLATSVLCMWPIAARLAQFRLTQASLAASHDKARLAAAELLEAQNWTRLAGQTAGLAYWRFDLATHTLAGSDGVIVGAERVVDICEGDQAWSSIHPNDMARLLAGIRKAVRNNGEFSDEIRLLRPDGSYRTAIARGACQHGEDGRVTAVLGAMFDVTELKRMESVAAESERRYRVLAEKVNDVIVWSTLDGRNTYVSPACQAVLGSPSEALLGFDAIDRIHPEDRARVHGIFKTMIGERREHAAEPVLFRIKHQDGHWVWLAGNPTMLFDERGQPSGFIDVLRDITAAKLVEAELLAARAAAEAATSAKTDFLANMSHELRTPLTAIMGFSGLLQECANLPESAQLYVRRITTAGKSLLAVVNDVLDFSKLEAGQLELDPHAFGVLGLIDDSVGVLSAQASNKGLSLHVDADINLPTRVVADSARLRQVLLNLLSNAVKFTTEGSVTIHARYGLGSTNADQLYISVVDTGQGIPADRRDRLFQRFSQADESISRSHGGTGLGLAICKRLVELMGGTIGVESDEGRGSTFWFTIDAPSDSGAQTLSDEENGPAVTTDLPPARILLVDDVAVNRELVRAMLTPFGHSFEEASNGAEAVQAAMQAPFDLILMDLQMPGMDGIAASRAIRATADVNRHTPIVALSANVLPEHLEACWEAGMSDHVAKPIVPAALLTKVAQWTHPQPAPDQERALISG